MIDIKQQVLGYESEIIALRRDFHENPELGFKEFRTSQIIYEYMKKLDIEVTNIARTGVVGVLQGGLGKGKTILIRASMDGLPIYEKNEVSYVSQNFGVMHASGHDADMAVVLVVAKILARNRMLFRGSVKFVFQPNEEEAGILSMIEEGVLEEPKVDAAFSLRHLADLQSGSLGITQGTVLGTTEEFEITITGKSGNTSAPHTGKDAILCAAKVIDALQVLETREYNPMYPMVLMIGQISGGTARTIISDQVKMGGTIRFLFPDEEESVEMIKNAFHRIIRGTCEAFSMDYEIQFIPSNPSLVNDKKLIYMLRSVLEKISGGKIENDEFKGLMGEDFAEISHRVPSVMMFVGCRNIEKGTIYPHNHPKFNVDEPIMKLGAEVLIEGVLQYLNESM